MVVGTQTVVNSQPASPVLPINHKAPEPQAPASTSISPRRVSRFSIKQAATSEAGTSTDVVSEDVAESVVQTGGQVKKIDAIELVVAWRTFAQQMPHEETAMSQRLDQMEPKMISDFEFEVIAENPVVAESIRSLAPRIQTFLQQKLGVPFLKMIITQRKPDEHVRMLTLAEQFNEMRTMSPAFEKLVKELELGL